MSDAEANGSDDGEFYVVEAILDKRGKLIKEYEAKLAEQAGGKKSRPAADLKKQRVSSSPARKAVGRRARASGSGTGIAEQSSSASSPASQPSSGKESAPATPASQSVAAAAAASPATVKGVGQPVPDGDWEVLVDRVVTVSKDREGALLATVQWAQTGKKQQVPIDTVNLRCPQKIIKFYQNHLKWA